MPKITLSKKSPSFHCPISGLTLSPGEYKDIPTSRTSWVYKKALKGGHIIIVQDSEVPQGVIDKGEVQELMILTRDAMMAKYDFLDEEHITEAKKKGTKLELAEYLVDVNKEYKD